MLVEDPHTTCRLGKGEGCCAFLAVGPVGFECLKNTQLELEIKSRLSAGTMVAKGEGNWGECLLKE